MVRKKNSAALAPVQALLGIAVKHEPTAESCPYCPGAHTSSACAGEEGSEGGAPVRRTPAHLRWALVRAVCYYYDNHTGGVGWVGWRRWGEKAGSGRPDQKSYEILKRPRPGGPLGTDPGGPLGHSEGPELSARARGPQMVGMGARRGSFPCFPPIVRASCALIVYLYACMSALRSAWVVERRVGTHLASGASHASVTSGARLAVHKAPG